MIVLILFSQVRTFHHIMGGVVDPHTSYLLLRGLKTLDLRVERHNSSGLEIARRLEKHPKIDRVWYPGLESHPDHAIAKKQVNACFLRLSADYFQYPMQLRA